MKRPYIPLPVKIAVAERQAKAAGSKLWVVYMTATQMAESLKSPWPLNRRLRVLLGMLFPDGQPYQLDHDPALVLRSKGRRKGVSVYIPDANDPAYLVYRTKEDHQQKTTGRKPGALKTVTTKGSDIGLKTKFARLERKGKKRKQKIPSRPFPKTRRKINARKK